MSIIRKPSTDPSTELKSLEHLKVTQSASAVSLAPDAPGTAVESHAKATEAGCGILNLNLHGIYSSEELRNGIKFAVNNYELGTVPAGRVIVEKVASTAIGSNVGSNLMVSANLFNTGAQQHYLQSGVNNSAGWSTSVNQSEVVPLGYAPIVSLLPNEYNRTLTVHYEPGTGLDDGLVQRYGHLSTGENLRANIVSFPGEDYYYVAKDHVVLDIIERNWDALGQDVPGERVREGNWIKVSDRLVDKVLDELNSKVLAHMPLTDLKALNFHVKADPALAAHLDPDADFPISLSLAVSYRSIAPEISE